VLRKPNLDEIAQRRATYITRLSIHLCNTRGRPVIEERKACRTGRQTLVGRAEAIRTQVNTRAVQPFQSLRVTHLAPGDSSAPEDLRPHEAAIAQRHTLRPLTHSPLQRSDSPSTESARHDSGPPSTLVLRLRRPTTREISSSTCNGFSA
jgi:hypothetical protein